MKKEKKKLKKGVDKKRQACIINNCRCDMAVWKMEYHISQRRMFEKENIDKRGFE